MNPSNWKATPKAIDLLISHYGAKAILDQQAPLWKIQETFHEQIVEPTYRPCLRRGQFTKFEHIENDYNGVELTLEKKSIRDHRHSLTGSIKKR